MYKLQICLVLLYTSSIFSQLSFLVKPVKNDNEQIIEKITELENLFNDEKYFSITDELLLNLFDNQLKTEFEEFKTNNEVSDQQLTLLLDEINIVNDSAKIIAEISYCLPDGNLEKRRIEIFLKKERIWRFVDLSLLKTNVFKALYSNRNKAANIEDFNTITPIMNDNTFIQVPVFTPSGSNPIYEVNYGVAKQTFNNQIFAANIGINWAGWYWPHGDGTNYYKLGLMLDNGWKRIVYSKDDLTGSVNLYDYGKWPGNISFNEPKGIDMNDFREIFISDIGNKCIYKLNYNFYSNSISATIPTIFINNNLFLKKPVDIDYHSGNNFNDRSDDYFVVADEELNCISIFDGNGSFKNKITNFYITGVGYIPISKPRSVVLYDKTQPIKIAFIDGGSNSLVTGYLNLTSNNLTPISIPTKFNGLSKLYDIGVDGCYNLIVTDVFGNKIHKFNKDGKYSCSFNKNLEIFNPYYASNVVDNCSPTLIGMQFFIGAAWGQSNGITEYYPGGDVINITNSNMNSYYKLQFFATDEIACKVELIRISTNQTVQVWDNLTILTATNKVITVPIDINLSNGNYKWKITYKPLYDDIYQPYSVGWKSKEVQFNHTNVAPIIASITQNPVPIYKGTYGDVYCNLSQGNGTINYNWFSTNQPSYIATSINGSNCRLTYLNTESIRGDAPTWDFGCTVTNPTFPGWSSTMRFSPSLNSDPNGCPTLAFEQNGNLVDENTLLVTSMSNPNKDVTDYYLINAPLAPVNNKINLTVHEPKTEHTWFDNISLLETRANPDEKIVVNDEGQVINYKGVVPARILLNGETDITQNLLEMDSLVVNLTAGDKLTISRGPVEGEGDVVLGGEQPPVAKDRPSMLMNVITEKKVEGSEEVKTESIPITNFFLRPNKSILSKRLRNLPSGTIEITVNKNLTLDYFVFVSDLRTARTRELPLASAVHNVNGDIKSRLMGIDQNYAEMFSTQRIDLSFSTTTNTGNRAYILKTVGRYETDTTYIGNKNNLSKLNDHPIIPTENKLYDNYPNPFNPNTIIKYSLKDDGKVSLKIFNTLGEEVRTLVNEIKPAGNYEVEFNVSDLSSGVYIYQLKSGDFVSSKKMLLIK